ncbi:alcohol dehydrogenase catalytic domain-containing protein [Paenirhodobacter enshiensis]|uniref:Enoyl reductase (ER) domain-containing protein n=1 Tax=Paenirhodobacter enshiensis TaxID=1105367 RepID=A0A086XXS8_9RHOB|nr:alcohol dehydrogenase catalytic domain-containing protein [Paenirhodobacter enshiensis]KFI26828.1 hypothetical protein CG50_00755 [Paenirhodobacter enshiensis]
MRAITLTTRGAAGVALREIPRPAELPGHVRVRMLTASVNRVDLYMRDSGAGITHRLPQVMGVDGAGEVISAPADSGLAPGTRVVLYPAVFCGLCRACLSGEQALCHHVRILGEHRDGTFAEEISVPVRAVLPVPPEADPVQAAVLGVAYLTAWRMVFGPGAAAGPGRTVLAMTGGEGADLVVDSVGERSWPASLRAAARGGHVVTCGATTGGHPSAEIQRLFVRQLSVRGSTLGSVEEFRRLLRCWLDGRLLPRIDSCFSLAEVPRAFDRLDDPARLGKIAIRIA